MSCLQTTTLVNFINWPIELGTAQLVTLILLANVAIDLGGCLCARKNMTPRNFSESIEAATKEEILANTEETKIKLVPLLINLMMLKKHLETLLLKTI